LERRDVMSASAVLSAQGVLTITGSTGAETVSLVRTGATVTVQGVPSGNSWGASLVKSVVIDLKGGGDTITIDSLKAGGNVQLGVPITIRSGAGSQLIHVWDSHDLTINGSGHTFVAAAGGSVSLDGGTPHWDQPAPVPPPPPPPPPAPPANTNWFDTHVTDAALRSLGHSLYGDGQINRSDMIALLRSAEDGNVIDGTEMSDLRAIVANTSLFGSLDYVDQLASDIVNGSVANAKYLGQALGNLSAGSASTKMENLIGKWFLGTDHPDATGDVYHQFSSYRAFSGSLFVGGATYQDIHQGYLGDCYFMSTLGEVALRNGSAITNMFIVNGDGTYTVKFFNAGRATYVTVDNQLPTDRNGRLIFAGLGMSYSSAGNELWTALAEKAYVQLNELGWERTGLSGNGQNKYTAIEGGYIFASQGHVTGQGTVAFVMTSSGTSFSAFVTAWNAGKSIGFASKSSPASSSVVGGHAYAVVGYNATNQTVTLFNPWGIEYGLVTLTWSQIQANFDYFDRTA
jgi:hypothetical protein